jgi:peptidoglycan/xylan/chitin deacetylase (PgdA/CDA1 family)
MYGIRLTATNAGGSDTKTENAFITVTEKPPGPSDAGIAITFDDDAVDKWYGIRDLLNQYDAHVTFFVSGFYDLTDSEVNKLRVLQQDGHEIAFHGYAHVEADEYLQSHTIQQYLDSEIIPGIELMQNEGFNPVDFAYPGGAGTEVLNEVLEDYFVHVRSTAYGSPVKNSNSVFYQYGSHTSHIYGIGLDESYGHSMDEIYDGIAKAKNEDKILIFYAHVPVTSNPGSSQISIDRIEKTLRNASENNLKFYTISEIE